MRNLFNKKEENMLLPANQIIQGDCVQILPTIPTESVDLVITDPPYLVNYRDSSGRTVMNDGGSGECLDAFADAYRVLRPNSFCISFYGWSRVDTFFAVWRKAGFRPVGHVVWQKDYSSRTGFVKYHHEQAYILAKGNPPRPAKPIADVQPWHYSGNRAHPTEKAVDILTPLVRAFSKPGDIILDPFAGSGSTAVAAALLGRRYIGIELEERFCEIARNRLKGVDQYTAKLDAASDKEAA